MRNSDPQVSEPIKTSIAPWLSVSRATEAVSYYQAAFGAVVRYRLEDDRGAVVVAQLAIGEADFWLQEDSGSSQEFQDHRSIRLILTVADPDTVFEQAITAGARAVFAVGEEHGWRVGRIADPFGHHWEIGKPLR